MSDELTLEKMEELWGATPTEEPEYAVIPVDGVAKTVRLDSDEFKRWLSGHSVVVKPCRTSIKT